MLAESAPLLCAPGIWQIPLPLPGRMLSSVNVYIVEDHDGMTLVDCGLSNAESWEILQQQLDVLGIPLRHIRRVLLTHTHPDHAGLAGRLAAETGAAIWVHKLDADFYRRRNIEAETFKRRVYDWLQAHGTPTEEARTLADGSAPMVKGASDHPTMESYRSGDHVQIGGYDFNVVWTPGHTPGHVCFMDELRQTVICGDHILPHVSPNVGMHVDTEINPLNGYLASLQEFSESTFSAALPGHGLPFSDIQSRARELREYQLGRQRLVREMLEVETLTMYELGQRVWTETKSNPWSQLWGHLRRNAIGTLVAHAELLREQGVLERTEDRPYRYGRG